MAQTVIDYKDEGAIFGTIAVVGIFILFIIGEPFIELWKFVISITTEHITKIRLFVYFFGSISVLFLAYIILLIYMKFGKLKVFLFYTSLEFLDLAITGNNVLIQFSFNTLHNLFNWLFGNV